MRGIKLILPLVLIVVLLFTTVAFAVSPIQGELNSVNTPRIQVVGTTATCSAKVTYLGQYIEATLELWQGGTLVASWNNTGTSSVTVSGNATIVHGLTYTLTVSGTANGVSFPPQSITRTL